MKNNKKRPRPCDTEPMPYMALTRVEGPIERHIEQLWDEIKELKKIVYELKEKCEKHKELENTGA